ncbi:MAG: thioesterase II family protein [Cyanobacteria bacterium J06633_8]
MIATSKRQSWVTFSKPNPKANLRLFCFPYAGGKATSFRRWENILPSNMEVCPIELPGRGTRMMEKPFTEFSQLIPELTKAIFPYLDKPFAFFGHSMGSIVCFEVAHLLQQKYGLSPLHLFVSGRSAPQIPMDNKLIHKLPEAAFIEELRRLNGTPEAVLENTELMQLLLPILRADFALVENYVYIPKPSLGCPISAFGGLQDSKVRSVNLGAWLQHTTSHFSMQMFPGDHFFLHSAEPLLLKYLSQKLHHLIHQTTA